MQQHTAANCIELQRTATHYHSLPLSATTAKYCNMPTVDSIDDVATRYSTLRHNATHSNALQRTATHSNALQRTPTHSSSISHIATCCNALQPIVATHCNVITLPIVDSIDDEATANTTSQQSASW